MNTTATVADLIEMAISRANGVTNSIARDRQVGRRTTGKTQLRDELAIVRGMMISVNLLTPSGWAVDPDIARLHEAIDRARQAIESVTGR